MLRSKRALEAWKSLRSVSTVKTPSLRPETSRWSRMQHLGAGRACARLVWLRLGGQSEARARDDNIDSLRHDEAPQLHFDSSDEPRAGQYLL